MNRDGFRAGRLVAEHEAAHAVICMLSGGVVGEVSIAPSKATRHLHQGYAFMFEGPPGWPVPPSPTAGSDSSAAGFAWELHEMGHPLWWLARAPHHVASWYLPCVRGSWQSAGGDRENYTAGRFLAATIRVLLRLQDHAVQAAIRDVADELQGRKSGTIWGGTVEKACVRHGLIPAAVRDFYSADVPHAELDPALT